VAKLGTLGYFVRNKACFSDNFEYEDTPKVDVFENS
jgi:hypothetical protein